MAENNSYKTTSLPTQERRTAKNKPLPTIFHNYPNDFYPKTQPFWNTIQKYINYFGIQSEKVE